MELYVFSFYKNQIKSIRTEHSENLGTFVWLRELELTKYFFKANSTNIVQDMSKFTRIHLHLYENTNFAYGLFGYTNMY